MSTIEAKPTTSLSTNLHLQYLAFIALYVAQGIVLGMVAYAIPAWMTANGKTPGEIGSFVSLAFLPWAFKIIFGPIMDRYTILSMGRKRPWVIFGQLGLILSFAALALVPDPLNNLSLMMFAAFSIGCFGAIQDVATDGMAIDLVPVEKQAKANSFMWGSKTIGTSATMALGSYLINSAGFSSAVLVLSVGIALIMLVPLFLREREGEKLMPWTQGQISSETEAFQNISWSSIFKSLAKVFLLRNSLLLAAIGFFVNLVFNFYETFMPVFTVQSLGWTDQIYSNNNGIGTFVGGLGGMILGGILIEKFGKLQMLNVYLGLFAMTFFCFFLCQDYWSEKYLITGFMIIFQILYVFTSIGFFAIAMQFCWKKVSATQFTLYMTVANIGYSLGAKALGPVQQLLHWNYSILILVPMVLIPWILLQFVVLSAQEKKVKEFEEKDLQNEFSIIGNAPIV